MREEDASPAAGGAVGCMGEAAEMEMVGNGDDDGVDDADDAGDEAADPVLVCVCIVLAVVTAGGRLTGDNALLGMLLIPIDGVRRV